jgi:hypothetical protein
LNVIFSFAQKVENSEGRYLMKIERNMTEDAAEQKCIELARIDAIRRAFGDVIFQGNSTYIQNKQGDKTETQNVFNFYSDTYANGEWLNDIEEPEISKIIEKGERWIEVTIKCRVRELRPSMVSFKFSAATCPKIECFTDQFNDGQDFYLYFKTPIEGYLTIFLDVPNDKTTYRILPYGKDASHSSVFVKADQDYFFFAKKHNEFGNNTAVDELTMTLTEKGVPETNRLFLLFSPNEFNDKPFLTGRPETKSQIEITSGNSQIPLHLPSKTFQEWQQKLRGRNKEIEYISFLININPIKL